MTRNSVIKKARFQKMAEEIEDYAIILLDEQGNIENWNKGAERIKGYTADEIVGKNFRIFYTDEARQAHLPETLLAKAVKEGKVKDEGWRVKKDGGRFWASVLITAIHGTDSQVIGFTKVTRDLTQQKHDEAKIKKSEERYHKMVDEVKDYAILLMDSNGIIENWNKGAEQIKGYKAEEIIGKNFRIFYRPEDRQNKLPDRLIEMAKTNGRAEHEGWRVRKDGTLFWGNITITALHDDNMNVIGFSKVTRDLTDRKRAEAVKRTEARNEELEHFAYVASHDLQEPLRTVTSFAELLRQDCQHLLSGESLQYLEFILQASDRMNKLIVDLLNYARLGRYKQPNYFDCNAVFQGVQIDLAATIHETKAVVKVGPLPTLYGYEMEVRLLFQNLLSNALKYHKAGIPPEITFTAQKKDGNWLFAMRDNGIGIEPRYYDKIFMLFQRLHNREDYSGTGIGLAECKKIVEMHDGNIWVDSELGEGSTFYFTLANQ